MPQVTAYKVPSANGQLYAEWTDPGNVYVSDNTRAVAANDQRNDYYGFSFAEGDIPVGATIRGFTVTCEAKPALDSGLTLYIKMVKAGVAVGNSLSNDQTFTDSSRDTSRTVGSSTDLGGASWTREDIVGVSTFGFLAHVVQAVGTGDLSIDQLRLQVYFDPPVPVNVDASFGALGSVTGPAAASALGAIAPAAAFGEFTLAGFALDHIGCWIPVTLGELGSITGPAASPSMGAFAVTAGFGDLGSLAGPTADVSSTWEPEPPAPTPPSALWPCIWRDPDWGYDATVDSYIETSANGATVTFALENWDEGGRVWPNVSFAGEHARIEARLLCSASVASDLVGLKVYLRYFQTAITGTWIYGMPLHSSPQVRMVVLTPPAWVTMAKIKALKVVFTSVIGPPATIRIYGFKLRMVKEKLAEKIVVERKNIITSPTTGYSEDLGAQQYVNPSWWREGPPTAARRWGRAQMKRPILSALWEEALKEGVKSKAEFVTWLKRRSDAR